MLLPDAILLAILYGRRLCCYVVLTPAMLVLGRALGRQVQAERPPPHTAVLSISRSTDAHSTNCDAQYTNARCTNADGLVLQVKGWGASAVTLHGRR
eukprot:3715830-Rhodomonas_salina.2